jgi:hypothetical protein
MKPQQLQLTMIHAMQNEKEPAVTVFIYYKIPTSERQHYLTAIQKLKQAIEERYPAVKITHQ